MVKYVVMMSMVLACGITHAAEKDGKFSTAKRVPASNNKTHPCATDALARALPLLKFHFGDNKCDQDIANESIDNKATMVGTKKLLVGTRSADVLQVIGYIYKASYRMQFYYAQIPGSCALMGQEIFEMSNPH